MEFEDFSGYENDEFDTAREQLSRWAKKLDLRPEQMSVLDLGCGSVNSSEYVNFKFPPNLCRAAASLGMSAYGIDLAEPGNKEPFTYIRANLVELLEKGLEAFLQGTVQTSKFTVVSCSHLTGPGSASPELGRFLRFRKETIKSFDKRMRRQAEQLVAHPGLLYWNGEEIYFAKK